RDPQKRVDAFDQLHYIPLGENDANYLSVGGQVRQWYEVFSTPPFGNGPKDSNGYLLQRYMLHLDLHWTSRLRFFVEFKGDLENGRTGGPRPDIDED
ncbi:alginate export family protein, partial [Enterococcus faecium]